MSHAAKMQLPYAAWPAEDRKRWSAANKSGVDPFDDLRTMPPILPSHLVGLYGEVTGGFSDLFRDTPPSAGLSTGDPIRS